MHLYDAAGSAYLLVRRVPAQITGKERDSESGLDYFGARYYGSALGRWTSPDLVNVTEQRLVNPSSTLNKYVYAANNPFKYVDPDGQDITYFYDQGGFAGHAVLFAYNQGNGDSAIESFGPASKSFVTRLREVDLEQVPGKSMFDMEIPQSAQDLRDTYATLTIQTTPELTQQVIDYMRANPDPKTWGVLGPNCSSEVLKILQKFKLDHKGWAPLQGLTPKFLWSNLYSQYVGQRVPVPQNGSKYGNLRNGYDPFDLLFLSLKQHCHTTTATWTENGKSTGTTSVTTCN
jgi:RHS repeat-associated protein